MDSAVQGHVEAVPEPLHGGQGLIGPVVQPAGGLDGVLEVVAVDGDHRHGRRHRQDRDVDGPGHPLGRPVPGARLRGGDGGLRHQVDVGPGDPGGVGGQDDGPVHLGQLGEALGAELGVEQEPARADGQHARARPPPPPGAPRLARRIRSSPSRSGRARRRHGQGVTERRALAGGHRRMVPVAAWPLRAGRSACRSTVRALRPVGRRRLTRRRCTRTGATASATVSTRISSHPRGASGRRGRHHHLVEPQPGRLLQPPGQVGDLADLAGQAHLPDRGQRWRAGPPRWRPRPRPGPRPGRRPARSPGCRRPPRRTRPRPAPAGRRARPARPGS